MTDFEGLNEPTSRDYVRSTSSIAFAMVWTKAEVSTPTLVTGNLFKRTSSDRIIGFTQDYVRSVYHLMVLTKTEESITSGPVTGIKSDTADIGFTGCSQDGLRNRRWLYQPSWVCSKRFNHRL